MPDPFVDLRNTNFAEADLTWSNLSRAKLIDANLDKTHFTLALLAEANLTGATLTKSELTLANLRSAILVNVVLREAKLDRANLINANLQGADLTGVQIGNTAFDNVDLSGVKGLDTIYHFGPSSIGLDTIIHSQGNIPEIFLRGVGAPSAIIEQIPALIGSLKPIDYHSCFISYSNKDETLAQRLYTDLQARGVSCWFAQHDLRTGQRIRYGIDEAIRQYDKLVLILSKDSIASTWVEFEVEAAMEKEKNGSEVLFPIRLDDTVMDSTTAWAAHIKRTRHIGDFTKWMERSEYNKAFSRLLRDLKAGT